MRRRIEKDDYADRAAFETVCRQLHTNWGAVYRPVAMLPPLQAPEHARDETRLLNHCLAAGWALYQQGQPVTCEILAAHKIVNGTLTAADIAGSQVVKSLNGLKDSVTLTAGSNVTITPAGNNLQIAATSSDVTGTGSDRYLARWNGTKNLTTSTLYQGTNGRIGIGTTSTDGILNVNKSIPGVVSEQTPSIMLGSNTSASMLIGKDHVNHLSLNWEDVESVGSISAPGTSLKLQPVDGSVSIGSGDGAPWERLHVRSGNAMISGTDNFAYNGSEGRLYLGDWNTYIKAVRGAGNAGGLRLGAYQAVDVVSIGNGGNVGIGTSNPSAKLEVNGNLTVTGNLNVTGQISFPPPKYDSGWVSIEKNQVKQLTHNIGGDTDKYMVDFQMKDTANGPHILFYGGAEILGDYFYGASWLNLTSTTISIFRQSSDTNCHQVRVRIWVYN